MFSKYMCTTPDKANSLDKLIALEFRHGKTSEQNTTMTDLSGIYVPDKPEKRKEKSFRMDSLRLEMKVLHPDLWKKYKRGHLECSIGTSLILVGSISVITGLVTNLTGDSEKKRTSKHLMISGGAMTAIGIPILSVGINRQLTTIRDCEKRMQDKQAELQFGIMSSGGLGLVLKF
jgi:hypothetical protein